VNFHPFKAESQLAESTDNHNQKYFESPAKPAGSPWILPLAAVCLVLITAFGADKMIGERALQEEHRSVLSQLGTIRARLEGVVNSNLLLVRGMIAEITGNPDITQEEFREFASHLMEQTGELRNIGAAPDLVISLMYPMKGNEAAIGLDYRKNPAQREAALRAYETGKIIIAGPVKLVQGGEGFIARMPVILPAREGNPPRPWGMVSTVMDVEAIYRKAGLHSEGLDLEVAIRGKDALGEKGETFFGTPTLFHETAVRLDVSLPDGSWQVAARPKGGWTATPPSVWIVRLTGLFTALLVGALTAIWARRIAERRQANESLREVTQHLQTLYDASPDMIFLHGADGRLVDVNENACRIFQFSKTEFLHNPPGFSMGEGYSAEMAFERIHRALAGEALDFDWMSKRKDGEEFPTEVRLRRMPKSARGGARVLAIVRDISERKQAEDALKQSEKRLSDAIESINEGFVLWNADDRLTLYNSRFESFYANPAHPLRKGVTFEAFLRGLSESGQVITDGQHGEWLKKRLEEHGLGTGAHECITRDGLWIKVSERRMSDGGTVGVHADFTEMRKAEERIRFRAYFDELTGLPNRSNFMEQLDSSIARSRRNKNNIALFFIDLDRFKKTDTVARLGGDEFTVLMHDLQDDIYATIIAENIIEQLSRPFNLAGHEVYSGASIGITICPGDGEDANTLLKNADMAMYRAKELGRNTFHYFTMEMTERAQHFVAMEKDLRRALEREEFIVHFQPVVALEGESVVGAEALIRWNHPEWGLVMPGDFIHVAEESRMIVEIGEWVLREACRQALKWRTTEADSAPYLAVNVSSRQFRGGFDQYVVKEILVDTGFPASRLVFEITESLLMDEDERIHQALQAFREMGIGLSVDDFGTGYSSLSYLRRFPVTTLKIDRSFISDLETNPSDVQLVESIIAMARGMKLQVIAEGVETEQQAEIIRRMGGALAQGFLYSRPLPVAEFGARFLAAE
jgi:PAS domain S-box-containing protein